jgi:hypothetical protein
VAAIAIAAPTTAQVQFVEKGQAAPFTGYLFSPDKEKEARQDSESLRYYKTLDETNIKLMALKDREMELIREQSKMWQEQSSELSKQLQQSKDSNFWKTTLYFGLGALLTTALAFGVNQATK